MTTQTRAPADSLSSEFLARIHTDFAAVHQVQTPAGMKLVFIARGGVLDGPSVHGEVLPGSSDWVSLGTDGVARMDVRAVIRLDDGELAIWTAQGVVHMSPETRTRMFGGEVIAQGEMYARSTHSFQTNSQKYSWLNALVAVARMSVGPAHVDYEFFRVL